MWNPSAGAGAATVLQRDKISLSLDVASSLMTLEFDFRWLDVIDQRYQKRNSSMLLG